MVSNETIQTILSRKSVRQFLPNPVPEDFISSLLECARFAPSGLNNQPWRFIVVDDKEIQMQLSELTHYSDILLSAPLSISVFLDTSASYHREKDIAAIGASIQNILLSAHSLGLGAVWLGEILKNKEKVSTVLNAPDSFELIAVIAIGYPDGSDSKRTDRKELQELVWNNRFSKK
ncbi:MAG: nitroreductase [Methanimicrococcus sp.]|nr:nitroreductase [Methanimicrococcus sp.]